MLLNIAWKLHAALGQLVTLLHKIFAFSLLYALKLNPDEVRSKFNTACSDENTKIVCYFLHEYLLKRNKILRKGLVAIKPLFVPKYF